MPYIKQERREGLGFLDFYPENSGELNFVLTSIVIRYLENHGLEYKTCNDIVGALENCRHEFQRRIQDPYEDKKIQDNGDVYE